MNKSTLLLRLGMGALALALIGQRFLPPTDVFDALKGAMFGIAIGLNLVSIGAFCVRRRA